MCGHHGLRRNFHYTNLNMEQDHSSEQLQISASYRWVCVTNHSGQQIVRPFFVCEVKQSTLSVTRLVEQGFQLTLDDNPRLHTAHQRIQQRTGEQKWPVLPTSRNRSIAKRNKATDTQRSSRTNWQDSADRNIDTTRSCRYRICRRLLAVQQRGELVTVHRQHRKTLFTTPSRTQCPVPEEQLEDYRRTTIRFKYNGWYNEHV